jgi:hypothetical protein
VSKDVLHSLLAVEKYRVRVTAEMAVGLLRKCAEFIDNKHSSLVLDGLTFVGQIISLLKD